MRRNLLLLIAAGLLAGLLYAESLAGGTASRWLVLAFKTPLSILFVVTAWLQPRVMPRYFKIVLIGLILGLVGDVCLALPGQGAFRTGLVAFLGGHILYIAAFVLLAHRRDWLSPAILLIVVVSGLVYWWLQPHLGEMLLPVTLYIVVISGMVAGAWAAFRNSAVPRAGAWFILIGAVLFYASDIFVAHQRFVMEHFYNRLIGLPLYYTGQFLLAFSVGLVKKDPLHPR